MSIIFIILLLLDSNYTQPLTEKLLKYVDFSFLNDLHRRRKVRGKREIRPERNKERKEREGEDEN